MKKEMDLRKANIQLIVFDFDGVMTDNRVIVSETGQESVVVNRADGLGVKILREQGFSMLILSTEMNGVVAARGRKLQIPVLQNVSDKAKALVEYCSERNIDMHGVMFVGNDINDLVAMKLVGIRVVPADAHPSVKGFAHIILSSPGGGGVVRELADLLENNILRNVSLLEGQ